MKRFYFLIPLATGCLVALLLGAGDPDTAYFPNINVATNVTIGGVLTVGPTNVIDELALKAPLASPALTGTPTINGQSIETQLTNKVAKAGDTMTGCLIAPGIQEQIGVISHSGTATLDFLPGANANKLVLTGAVTIAFSNLETNRYYHLMVANAQATNCDYVLPAVKFMGYYPTNIVAGKTAEWFFKVDPQTNSIVYAKYVEQQ